MDIKKILMTTDFSDCANAALNHALFLAEHLDADLDLLHVVVLHNVDPLDPTARFPDADEIYHRLQEIASGEMKDLVKDHHVGMLEIHEYVRRSVAAAPAIIEHASEAGVDLIVMGAHGRRGFRRFLLGSVTEEVVRLAPCPVLTLRGMGETPELHAFKTIVVPFDFSGPAKEALGTAKELARRWDSRLRVVHVVEPIMEPHPYVPLHYRTEGFEMPRLLARVKDDLVPMVREVGDPAVECEIDVLEGSPGVRIAEHAEEIGADLLVTATHGRTGIQRFFLGNVTEKVVRGATCPVLTVKTAAAKGAQKAA